MKRLKDLDKKERKKEIIFRIDTVIAIVILLIVVYAIIRFIGWTISGGLYASICGFILAIFFLIALF